MKFVAQDFKTKREDLFHVNLQAQRKNKTITKSGKLKFLGKNSSYVSLVINDALFSFYLELLWIWILRNVQNCSGVIKKKLNFWKFLTDFVLKLTLLCATCGGKFKLLTKTSPKTNENWGNFWTEKWYVFLRKDTDWRYF